MAARIMALHLERTGELFTPATSPEECPFAVLQDPKQRDRKSHFQQPPLKVSLVPNERLATCWGFAYWTLRCNTLGGE